MRHSSILCSLTMALSLLLTVRCAYFNTFYNAKQAYRKARDAHEDFKMENPDAEELPPSIISNYDRAIQKSIKILNFYPKDRQWHDDALFLIGRSLYYKGAYSSAIRRLRQLQKEFPQSPYIPQSHVFIGRAHLANEQYLDAEETFSFILEHFPDLNKNEEISFLLARLAIQRGGRGQAVAVLEKIKTSISDPRRTMELIIDVARFYADLHQFKKALILLNDAPRSRDHGTFLFRIDSLQVFCLRNLDSLQAALNKTNTMLKNKRYSHRIGDILLMKADVLHDSGNHEVAQTLYLQIIESHDSSSVAARAHLRLGRLYRNKHGDLELARRSFTRAEEMAAASDSVREEARHLGQAIDSIIAFQALVHDSADTTLTDSGRIEIYFKIGETFWYDLDVGDSAVFWLKKIITSDNVSPEKRMQSLYAAAVILRTKCGDTAAADSLYYLLNNEYPRSRYAAAARDEWESEDTIIADEEAAEMEFEQAEALHFEKQKPTQAIRAHLRVVRKWPETDAAPHALYAAAWLLDNVLEKNRQALALYKRLCRTYPDSDYCREDARRRLKTAIDSLTARKQSKNGSR